MIDRRFFLEAVALVIAAILCATVSNVVASRERKLALVGNYATGRSELPARSVIPATTTTQAVTATSPTTTAPLLVPPLAETAATTTVASTTTSTAAKPVVATTTAAPIAVPPRSYPPHPDKPWVEVAWADVDYLYKAKAPFIDARRSSVYEEGHIAGARSVPVWESDVDDRVKKIYEENWNSEAPVVIYCSGGDCEDSHMLGQKLWGVGLNNILVYRDGFPDWVKHGGPVHQGAQP